MIRSIIQLNKECASSDASPDCLRKVELFLVSIFLELNIDVSDIFQHAIWIALQG